MVTPAGIRSANVSFRDVLATLFSFILAGALTATADAARHPFTAPGHDEPSVSIQLGRQHGTEPLKTFVFPIRKPVRAASPAPDLPFFQNPLVRRHMAITPGTATPLETADVI